ncbi:MAG TPA: GNAT family N-acetyltransferase [Candidatus Baltobacteraceae bacterium]
MALARGKRALSKDFAVRLGTARDRGFITDLGRRTISSSASSVRSATASSLEGSYLRLVDFIYTQPHVLLVAHDPQRPLGFLALLDELPDEVSEAPQGFIAYMAVEEDVRRSHIASALLARAEEIARERGLPALALMVTEENDGARELYARAGFVTERRLLVKTL